MMGNKDFLSGGCDMGSLTRELKIRVVGFALKKLLTYFEMLIVPHALQCVDGCFFVFYRI